REAVSDRAAVAPSGSDRPQAAVDDFSIERPVACCHRPFASVTMTINRRRNQLFVCAPGNAPIERQLSRYVTTSSYQQRLTPTPPTR
ncbi:MAG: hypothetical protein JSW31_03935, partial [Burkholderiales bacterium]